jgi:predicted MPP superfamily phosphohydrolase
MLFGDVLWCSRALAKCRDPRRRWIGVGEAAFGLAQIAGVLIILVSRGGMGTVADAVPRAVYAAVFVWHMLLLPLWLLWQLGSGLSTLAKKIARVEPPAHVEETPAVLSRRKFIGVAAAFTPPFLSLGGAAFGETQLDDFRIRRLVVPIANLPPALDGLTIAHVTDSHVGRFTRGRVLERVVEETNRLDADIVAFTGDLINDSLRAMPPALEMAAGLRARHFKIACEGNHDLIENAAAFYREAEKGGFPLLRNDTASVTIRGQRVQFLGLPWNHGARETRESVRALLAKRDPAAWPLLLAHHPHAWDAAEGIPLTLAGHTHGGQIMFTPQAGFGSWIYRYWSGLYTREGNALVVSNGVGNWFPVRVQAPAEIVHLTLRTVTQAASASSRESSAGSRSAVSGGGLRS